MYARLLCVFLLWTIILPHASWTAKPTYTHGKSSPCSNGGTYYKDKKSVARCLCAVGFVGPACDVPDPCVPNPCKNLGSCAFSGNTSLASCYCLPGFTGDNCGNEISPCDSSPCESGVCHKNGSSYHCQCPYGYSGPTCQTYDGLCASSPCKTNDVSAVCTESDPGYSCSCSDDSFYGLHCESKALPLPPGGCQEEKEPESYCLCSANGRSVKVPLKRPQNGRGVKSRDFLAGMLGFVLGWLLGTALLSLYHYCCSYASSGLYAATPVRVGPARHTRPYSASSEQSQSTNLSGYMHAEPKPTQPPYASPPFHQTAVIAAAATTTEPEQHPPVFEMPTTPMPSSRAPDTPKATNIYRAAFIDDMAHQVSHRKSTLTYNSAMKDW